MFNMFILPKWEDLPDFLKNEDVKPYYNILLKKRFSLFIKRIFDIFVSFILLIFFSPIIVIISIFIKIDSKGNIFFKQKRVTRLGKIFYIIKFRSMITDDKKIEVTFKDDNRITKFGNIIRKFRLDEIPQLINILIGDMTFVGTRPEVQSFVNEYNDEMLATLLLPAGLTSSASIEFKNEADMIYDKDCYFNIYIQKILPEKMKYNLMYINEFSFFYDIKILFFTIFKVFK